MKPFEALELLGANLEVLVAMTGDVPPTPPPPTPPTPNMKGMQTEKANIARTHSDNNLARLRNQAPESGSEAQDKHSGGIDESRKNNKEDIDGVQLRQPSGPTFQQQTTRPPPYIIMDSNLQPINLQHGFITRKFYSRGEPPVSIHEYLMRLYDNCPMSTAVYLATSLYIYRLAVVERAIPVTRRNAHRLVLAALRVATKALEDLCYSHRKMAAVGGVSEAELARLEISFCFLAGFDLMVDLEQLQRHHHNLIHGANELSALGMVVPPVVRKRSTERAQHAG